MKITFIDGAGWPSQNDGMPSGGGRDNNFDGVPNGPSQTGNPSGGGRGNK